MLKSIKKILSGFIIISFIQFMCNVFLKLTHIVFPAPIMGILILLTLLELKIVKSDWIKDFCNFIFKYMPILFVPLFVGMICYYEIIHKNMLSIITNVILTTTITLIVTALFVENVIKYVRLEKLRKHRDD